MRFSEASLGGSGGSGSQQREILKACVCVSVVSVNGAVLSAPGLVLFHEAMLRF